MPEQTKRELYPDAVRRRGFCTRSPVVCRGVPLKSFWFFLANFFFFFAGPAFCPRWHRPMKDGESRQRVVKRDLLWLESDLPRPEPDCCWRRRRRSSLCWTFRNAERGLFQNPPPAQPYREQAANTAAGLTFFFFSPVFMPWKG